MTTTTITSTEAKSLAHRLKRSRAKNGHLPVLRYAHVDASPEGEVRFRATDLEVEQEIVLPGIPGPARPFLVDLDRLTKIAPLGDELELSGHDETSRITASGITAEMTTPPVSEFPKFREPDGYTIKVPVQRFSEILPAIYGDPDRSPTLRSLAIRSNGDLVGTDSYRLVRITGDPVPEVGDGLLVIVEAVKLITLAKPDGPVSVTVFDDGRDARFDLSDGYAVTTRLTVGDYPSYRSLIPDPASASCRVQVEEDVEAQLRKLAPMLGSSPIRFELDDDLTTVNGRSIVGDDTYSLPIGTMVEPGEEPGPVVAFNPTYLADMLASTESKIIQGIDHLKPWVAFDGDVTHLLMPVRTG